MKGLSNMCYVVARDQKNPLLRHCQCSTECGGDGREWVELKPNMGKRIWLQLTKRDDDAVPLQAATSLFCVLGNKMYTGNLSEGLGPSHFQPFDLVPPKILA